MNKTIRISKLFIIIIILVLTVSVLLYTGFTIEKTIEETPAKNVILMIGDGMGVNHIEAAKIYYGLNSLNMEALPYNGLVNTLCLFGITDSAAAATAMACGEKTYQGAVGITLKSGAKKNITTVARELGKKTGIVCTKTVTDATPAAFSSHVALRQMSEAIALQQVNSANLDLLFGAGKDSFTNYYDVLREKGYEIAETKEALLESEASKLFALFDSLNADSELSLSMMTEKALELLDNDNGFFLMAEGSKIDSYSHSNDIIGMLKELYAFDLAVKIAYEYAMNNPDTILIVTADHETGGIEFPDNFNYNDISDSLFTTDNHTDNMVRYFAYGKGLEDISSEIDNTDVAKIIAKAMGGAL